MQQDHFAMSIIWMASKIADQRSFKITTEISIVIFFFILSCVDFLNGIKAMCCVKNTLKNPETIMQFHQCGKVKLRAERGN